jgi:hypothetical protein
MSSLTLGTFLFTMKTFIIQTIKKEIYDQEMYKEIVANRAELGKKPPVYYAPLKKLSTLIFLAILTALLNSFLQITIGYMDHKITAWICLIFSGVSWMIVTVVLFQVGGNMQDMINFAELQSQSKPEKAEKKDK